MVHNEHNLGDKQRMHAELNITGFVIFSHFTEHHQYRDQDRLALC